MIGICVILPIELTQFNAVLSDISDNTIKLSWETASELNAGTFVIERANEHLNFDSIAKVKASGNSVVILSYSYFDTPDWIGQLYYRLRMIDLDGSFTYSDIVSIETRGNLPISLVDNLLQYSGSAESRLVVCSTLGRVVYEATVNAGYQVDLGFLRPGIYFVTVQNSTLESRAIQIF
jgi:hypothetical protein